MSASVARNCRTGRSWRRPGDSNTTSPGSALSRAMTSAAFQIARHLHFAADKVEAGGDVIGGLADQNDLADLGFRRSLGQVIKIAALGAAAQDQVDAALVGGQRLDAPRPRWSPWSHSHK